MYECGISEFTHSKWINGFVSKVHFKQSKKFQNFSLLTVLINRVCLRTDVIDQLPTSQVSRRALTMLASKYSYTQKLV